MMLVGAPVVMGSMYGVPVGIAITVLLVWRIVGEERMLSRELVGYRDYAKLIKYRLFPFIW